MTLIVFNDEEFLYVFKQYKRHLESKESIVCVLQNDIKSFFEQNIASCAAHYYEPNICIIVYERETIPYCLIQDIIRSSNLEKFPIVTGIVVQNLLPKLSLLPHLSQDFGINDDLYNLFFYLTNYFFETCIIPLLVPKQLQLSSSASLSVISAVENIIKHYENNIEVMKKMVFKQNKFSIMINKFKHSLTVKEIATIKQTANLFSKKMKFTYQMSEQLQKSAIAASFFSYETVYRNASS